MGRVMIVITILLGLFGFAAADDDAKVRIYLPRSLKTDSDSLRLGAICVIRCDDEKISQQVNEIQMGRGPWSGEKLVVDRRTILSRLAASGISKDKVAFTGAESIILTRDEQVAESSDLLRTADAFLKKHRPGPAGCTYKLVRDIEAVALPAGNDVEISCEFAKDAPAGHVKINFVGVAGEKKIDAGSALFKLVYAARRAVAADDIAAGEVLTADNIRVEIITSDVPPDPNWTAPIGEVATKEIPAGTVLVPAMTKQPAPAVVVKQNETIVMRVEGAGFTVSALVTAMQDGRPGEIINVRNIDTKRVVSAKVFPDGTVRPIYEGSGK